MPKKKKPEPTKNEKQLEAQVKRIQKARKKLKKERDDRATGLKKRGGPIKRSREIHYAACDAGTAEDPLPEDRAKANAARLDKVQKTYVHLGKLEDDREKFATKMKGLIRHADEKLDEAIFGDQLDLLAAKAKRGPKTAPKKKASKK